MFFHREKINLGSLYVKQCVTQIKLSGKFMNNLALNFNVLEDVFSREFLQIELECKGSISFWLRWKLEFKTQYVEDTLDSNPDVFVSSSISNCEIH